MKHIFLLLCPLIALTACTTTHTKSTTADPETVLVTYRVKSGKEADLRAVLSSGWEIYRKDNLVFAEPHVVLQDTEEGGKPRIIEILTWVNRSTPEHAPDSVKAIWKKEESLCEQRGKYYGIEPAEVELVLPSPK